MKATDEVQGRKEKRHRGRGDKGAPRSCPAQLGPERPVRDNKREKRERAYCVHRNVRGDELRGKSIKRGGQS